MFKNLWNIQDNTTGQVSIVPVGDEDSVFIGHGVSYWSELLYELIVQRKNAQDAITTANGWLLQQKKDIAGNPITEQWQPIGDGNVQIN